MLNFKKIFSIERIICQKDDSEVRPEVHGSTRPVGGLPDRRLGVIIIDIRYLPGYISNASFYLEMLYIRRYRHCGQRVCP